MSTRLYRLPVLVGVPHKVGVSSSPPLHAPRVQSRRCLLIKLLKVLGVQGVFHSGLVWGLGAVQVVPVYAIKEWMALQWQTECGQLRKWIHGTPVFCHQCPQSGRIQVVHSGSTALMNHCLETQTCIDTLGMRAQSCVDVKSGCAGPERQSLCASKLNKWCKLSHTHATTPFAVLYS